MTLDIELGQANEALNSHQNSRTKTCIIYKYKCMLIWTFLALNIFQLIYSSMDKITFGHFLNNITQAILHKSNND